MVSHAGLAEHADTRSHRSHGQLTVTPWVYHAFRKGQAAGPGSDMWILSKARVTVRQLNAFWAIPRSCLGLTGMRTSVTLATNSGCWLPDL
jgi:hypothetical protein